MKQFILLASILALALSLFADNIEIGWGTDTQRFPLGAYYGYERSAALYQASEIGPQSIRISEISWYSENETWVSVPIKIYLKTTSDYYLINSDWDYMISDATLLYDEDLNGLGEGSWNSFELYDSFDVEQGDNLIVLVETNYGDWGGDSSEGGGIRYSTLYDGIHLIWYQDDEPSPYYGESSEDRPNISLTYTSYATDTPPNPALLYSPDHNAINVASYATLNWASGGGAPTGYKLYLGTDNPPTNIVNGTDLGNVFTYDPNGLAYSSTYYWKVVPYNVNGDASGSPVWKFTITDDPLLFPPWLEDFGTSYAFPPLNWERLYGLHGVNMPMVSPSGWTYDDFCNLVTAPRNNSAALNIWGTNARYWLVTPPTALPAAGYRLKFDLGLTKYSGVNIPPDAGAQADDKFIVLIDDNVMMSSPTILRQWDNAGSAYVYDDISAFGESVNLDLSAYTGTYYIAFYGESTASGGDNNVYVDNVEISLAQNHDVKPIAINTPEVVGLTALQPQATVENNGLNTESFSVTMTIGSYSDVKSVSGLLPGSTQLLTFASYLPVQNAVEMVSVSTNLAGDEDTSNDEITGILIGLDLDVQAYADIVTDNNWVPYLGPATFNLADPGTLTDLPAESPFNASFLAGADWINGGWQGTEYNISGGSPFWEIDHVTGDGTLLGTGSVNMNGVAYDAVHDIIYACSEDTALYQSSLHTLSATGESTLLGALSWDGNPSAELFIIGLAYDNLNGILYGLDILSDSVFTIDPLTLLCTPLGYGVGLPLNYGQDMAFDQNSGMLYISAYTSPGGGMLLWVNTLLPDEDGKMGQAFLIGEFQNQAQVAGFVIPYIADLPMLELNIDSTGTLSWSDVGALSYKIYASDNPHTGFSLLTTVSGTSWVDPSFPQQKKFYYVTSFVPDSRMADGRVSLSGAQHLKKGIPVEPGTRSIKASETSAGISPSMKK